MLFDEIAYKDFNNQDSVYLSHIIIHQLSNLSWPNLASAILNLFEILLMHSCACMPFGSHNMFFTLLGVLFFYDSLISITLQVLTKTSPLWKFFSAPCLDCSLLLDCFNNPSVLNFSHSRIITCSFYSFRV